jgi:hypothetical protein
MTRAPLLLLGLLAACGDPSGTGKNPAPASPSAKQSVAPAGGIPQMRAMYDGLAADVKRFEEARAAGKAPAPEEVRGTVRAVQNLVRAASMAQEAEAKMDLEREHALLVKRYGEHFADSDQLAVEIDEMQKVLDGIERGTTPVPPGHTAAELQAKHSELLERRLEMSKQAAEMREELQKQEERLAAIRKGEKPPKESDSLLFRELQSYRILLDRAEKLLLP